MRRAVDAKGLAALKPELDRIAAAQDKGDLIDELGHLDLVGAGSLFSFYSSPDLHNADQVIAYIDQGGLSLPDRDYYIKDDSDQVKKRQNLVDYATQVFALAGQNPQQAAHSRANCSAAQSKPLLAADSMDPDQAPRSEESRSQNEPR